MDTQVTVDAMQVRDPRRILTRARICAAAKELFFQYGVPAVTADQIAQAAGIRRSTFYTHFRDKDELLGSIAQDYLRAIRDLLTRLPGPVPTRQQIDDWLGDLAEFAHRERVTTEIVMLFTHSVNQAPPSIRDEAEELFRILSLQLPAFRKALEQQGIHIARANLALREIGWAICFNARENGSAAATDILAAAAEVFERFVQTDF